MIFPRFSLDFSVLLFPSNHNRVRNVFKRFFKGCTSHDLSYITFWNVRLGLVILGQINHAEIQCHSGHGDHANKELRL